MMKKILIATVLIIVILFVVFWIALNKRQQPMPAAAANNLNADVYPLYSGISWNPEQSAIFEKMSGYEVTSTPITDISNIAEISTPFDKYYANKLKNSGWAVDQSLAAGGPGSSITAYTKDGDYIVVSYFTKFKGGGKDEPVQCPCDTSFSVFSGKDITSKLISEISYKCDSGKTIDASYYDGPPAPKPQPGEPPTPTGSVHLILSDGRQITLPQTISGSGIRYATTDDSFVFFSKGDGALILENNQQTYTGCAEITSKP